MIDKIKKLGTRYKWRVLTVIFVLLVLVLFPLWVNDKSMVDKITEWLFDQRIKTVDKIVKQHEDKQGELSKSVKEARDKIERLKRQQSRRKLGVDRMSMKEVADVFKDLGY